MSNELKEQTLAHLNEIIADYNSSIEELNGRKANLEEEYRQKLEAERQRIDSDIASYQEMLKFWNDAVTRLGESPNLEAATEKKTRTRKAKAETAQEETPVTTEDTVFGTEEVPAETPAQEEEEKVVDTIFPENNEPETVESSDENSDAASEEVEEEATPDVFGSTDEDDAVISSGWPEMPEEWKV